jgi:putative aminopeptidase FrvX
MLNRKDSKKFLLDYLSTPSPTGEEKEGQRKWLEYISDFVDGTYTDTYGSGVGVINPDADFKVVLEAHADEIGWNVNYISEDGYISVNRNGGSDNAIAASKVVDIHTKDGIVKGVFGQTAIHMRERGDEKVTKVEDLFIDVGVSTKEEVLDMGIHVGTKITYPDPPFFMGDDRLVGRALDNRVGGFMIAEAARLFKKHQETYGVGKPEFGLYIVNSVQEEIGLRGAEMVVDKLKPNVAIVTDVCHDTSTPGINPKKHGDTRIGRGPVIAYAPPIHNTLRDMVINCADTHNIDFQRLSSSSSSGTDADAFAYGNGGTPTALIKIPLKYMHTTVETAKVSDIEQAIILMYNFLVDFDPNKNLNYFEQ